jgi:Pyruvate/2-oxoacid:ferredoxin oxidoreductase gamma subunit
MEITKADFEAYERVRLSGVTNMFMVSTVCDLSGLEREQVKDIIKNYETYEAKWPDVRGKA